MSDEKKRDCILGVVLGTAIGDTLGFQVEFSSMPSIRARFGCVQDFPKGALYSDDTQMFRAVCEGLIRARSTEIEKTAEEVAEEFVAWAESDENNRAPGGACMLGCRNLASGEDWRQAGKKNGGGCGVAMRSMGYGLWLDNPFKAAEMAYEHGAMTHRLPMAQASGAAVALIVAALRADYTPREAAALAVAVVAKYDQVEPKCKPPLAEMMQRAINMADYARERPGSVRESITSKVLDRWRGWVGHEAVAASLYCFLLHSQDFGAAVTAAVNSPGDSDSLGAITGAFSGAYLGASQILKEWKEKVEKTEELHALADRLIEAKKSLNS